MVPGRGPAAPPPPMVWSVVRPLDFIDFHWFSPLLRGSCEDCCAGAPRRLERGPLEVTFAFSSDVCTFWHTLEDHWGAMVLDFSDFVSIS